MSFLTDLFENPLSAITFLVALVAAITIHEFAHAWAADRLGDDTPRLMGRVTLNPLAHLDPVGSIAFILAGFGWGRPVEYNPMRLSRRVDELLIALAGPASNLLLAFAIMFLGHFGVLGFLNDEVFATLVSVNVLLAAFNMLPIPPLDGSSIIAYFWPEYRSIVGGQIGLVILLFLIVSGALPHIVNPIMTGFLNLVTLFGVL